MSQSTIFQSCRDGATASWVINQYFRGVKCLAQGHNTAVVGFEPPTSRSGVRHSTTEPPRSENKAAIRNDTLLFLSFRTDKSGQTVQTQIRLLFWMHYSKDTPSCSTIRVIKINFRVCEILGFLR